MTNKIRCRDMMANAFMIAMISLIALCLIASLCGCRVVEVENRGEEIARDADGKPVLLQDGTIQTVKKGWSVYHNQHWMVTEADSLTAGVKKDEINFALNGLNTQPSEQLGVVIDKSITGVALLAEKVGAAIVSSGGSVASDAAKAAISKAISNFIGKGGDVTKAEATCEGGNCIISDGTISEICTDCMER